MAAGEALRLECVVQADPPVQVTWAKGGDILQNGPDYQIVYRNGVCRLIIPHVFPGVCPCSLWDANWCPGSVVTGDCCSCLVLALCWLPTGTGILTVKIWDQ